MTYKLTGSVLSTTLRGQCSWHIYCAEHRGHREGTTHLTKTAQPIRGAGVEIQPKPGYHTLYDLVIVAKIKGVPRNSHSLEIIGFEEKAWPALVDPVMTQEEEVYKIVFKSLTKVEKQGQSCSGPWRWLRTVPMYGARKLLPSLCLEMTAAILCPVGITKRTDPRSLNFLCVIQGNLSPKIWLFYDLYTPTN